MDHRSVKSSYISHFLIDLLTGSSVEVLAKVILIPWPRSSLCLATAIGRSAECGKEGLGSTLGSKI